ncbi:MAG: hypothetical protein K0Q72_1492 [Armatimonadetes bacterium]|nr:hypothetical protein [Armatimonadota bacterium]
MVISFVLGLLATVVYCSFAEWFVHRYGMHTQRLSKWAFKRHAIQHHSMRRSLKTFYAVDVYKIWQSSAIPGLWLLHLPMFWGVATLTNWWAGAGAAAGAGLYITFYEVLHFHIHTPRGYWFQRTRLFHFYCEYHRVHHHRAKWNYNVVCPLADAVMRTLSMEEMPPEPSAPADVPRHTGPRSVFSRPVVATGADSRKAD